MSRIKEKPYHLLLLPLFFAGKHFFTIAISSPPSVVFSILNFLGSFAVCLAFSFGIYFLLSRRISKINASLISALLFSFIFLFHDILLLTNNVMSGNVRVRWLIPAGSVLVLVVIFVLYRSRTSFIRLNEYLNLVSTALVVYILIQIVLSYPLRPRRFEYEAKVYQKTCTDCPDIYFFLLDSYTSNASLKKYFDFDNSKFKRELNDLGFIVNDTAHSDYLNTRTSLASTLNLGRREDLESYYQGDIHQMIKTNSTARSLDAWGYDIHSHSIFEILDHPKFYSVTFDLKPQFLDAVFQATIFHIVFEYFQTNKDMYSIHRNILRLTEDIATSKHDRPTFVYSHLLAPHSPFVIDSLGQEVPLSLARQDNKRLYVDEIKGLNGMLLKTVTTIRQSSPSAIVILQGDHGYRSLPVDTEKEAHTVFFAYFGPNEPAVQKLNSSHEVFRVVLGTLGHE